MKGESDIRPAPVSSPGLPNACYFHMRVVSGLMPLRHEPFSAPGAANARARHPETRRLMSAQLGFTGSSSSVSSHLSFRYLDRLLGVNFVALASFFGC